MDNGGALAYNQALTQDLIPAINSRRTIARGM